MADHLISAAPANVPTDSPQSLYISSLSGRDYLQVKSSPATDQIEVRPPLQLMPEIHGQPAPHDQQKTSDVKTQCDKTLFGIAAADASALSPPSREAQAVVKQFLAEKAHAAEKEKPALLKKFGPGFDRAITAADSAYYKVESTAEPAIKSAKERYIEVNSVYNQTFQDTVEQAKQLPNPIKQSAANLLAQVGVGGAKMPAEADLKRVFRDQPEFLESLIGLTSSQNAVFAASDNLDIVNKPVLDAALEQDRTRLAYERSAQSVGARSLAKGIDVERRLIAEQTKQLTDAPEDLRSVTKI